MDLVIRSALPPNELAAGVRAALVPVVPYLPGKDYRLTEQLVEKSVRSAASGQDASTAGSVRTGQ